MTATAVNKAPILPAYVPKVYGYVDPIASHNQAAADVLKNIGWQGLFYRWLWPCTIRTRTPPVVRLIGFADGSGGQPYEVLELVRLLTLGPIIAYHRVPPDKDLRRWVDEWHARGGISWIEGSGVGQVKGVPTPNRRQVMRDAILSLNPLNKSETWPDRMDPTDGTIGGLVIQDTQWTATPWPANFKPKSLKPPGGVVNWLDWTPKNLDTDMAAYFARCSADQQDCCIGADLIVDRGVKLP